MYKRCPTFCSRHVILWLSYLLMKPHVHTHTKSNCTSFRKWSGHPFTKCTVYHKQNLKDLFTPYGHRTYPEQEMFHIFQVRVPALVFSKGIADTWRKGLHNQQNWSGHPSVNSKNMISIYFKHFQWKWSFDLWLRPWLKSIKFHFSYL